MPAAVTVLVYSKNDKSIILLHKRTDKVEHHKGEISFPGGVKDPDDADFMATALRETYEEMGISPADIKILGQLDDVTTRTNFVIKPFVGTIPYPYTFNVNIDEVAEVIEIPLEELLKPANIREEALLTPDGQTIRAYAYAYNAHLVYGATAAIVTQLIEIIRGEWR